MFCLSGQANSSQNSNADNILPDLLKCYGNRSDHSENIQHNVHCLAPLPSPYQQTLTAAVRRIGHIVQLTFIMFIITITIRGSIPFCFETPKQIIFASDV